MGVTRLSETAVAELRDRYLAEAIATERRANYLAALLDQLGIDPGRYAGFDDATGEIILLEEEAAGAK